MRGVVDFEVRYGGAGRGWFVMRRSSATGWKTVSGPWTRREEAEDDCAHRWQRARFARHSVRVDLMDEGA